MSFLYIDLTRRWKNLMDYVVSVHGKVRVSLFRPLGPEQTVTIRLMTVVISKKSQYVQSPCQKSLESRQKSRSLFSTSCQHVVTI